MCHEKWWGACVMRRSGGLHVLREVTGKVDEEVNEGQDAWTRAQRVVRHLAIAGTVVR